MFIDAATSELMHLEMVEISRALTIVPLDDLDAGDALKRLDRVGGGQLADILCVDRVHDLVGVGLDRLGRAEELADAGDDDVLIADRSLRRLICGDVSGRLDGRAGGLCLGAIAGSYRNCRDRGAGRVRLRPVVSHLARGRAR